MNWVEIPSIISQPPLHTSRSLVLNTTARRVLDIPHVYNPSVIGNASFVVASSSVSSKAIVGSVHIIITSRKTAFVEYPLCVHHPMVLVLQSVSMHNRSGLNCIRPFPRQTSCQSPSWKYCDHVDQIIRIRMTMSHMGLPHGRSYRPPDRRHAACDGTT